MNSLRRRYDSYRGGIAFEFDQEKASLLPSDPMAEEEDQEAEDIGSSSTISKEQRGDDDDRTLKGWLHLGIGGDSTRSSKRSLELNLFPDNIISSQPILTERYNFGNRIHGSNEFRVVSAPQRQHVGLWFELKALGNQGKQPFLPQIPKSHLRIKDGRMTVRLLMKYLANKLGLDDELQVEITCRGQQLHPVLSLQCIRDNIWRTRSTTTTMVMILNPPISDSMMILNYCRRA